MTKPMKPDPDGVADILFRDKDGGEVGPNGELQPNPEWIARIEREVGEVTAEPEDGAERTVRTTTEPYPYGSLPDMPIVHAETVLTKPSPGIGSRLWKFLTTPIPPAFGGRVLDAALESFYRQMGVEPSETSSDPAWISTLKQGHAARRQRREQVRSAQRELPLERLVGVAYSNSLETRNYYVDTAARVFAVADGDGFARDVATAYALEAAQRVAGYVRTQTEQNPGVFYDDQKRAELQERIEVEIEDANARIHEKAEMPKRPELQGMNASLTLAVIAGNHLFTANVGTGRAYHLRVAGKNGGADRQWTLAPEQATDDTEHRLGRTDEFRASCAAQPLTGDVLLTSPAAHYFKMEDVREVVGRAFWRMTRRVPPQMTVSYEINPHDIAERVSAALTQPLVDVDPKKPSSEIGYHAFNEAVLKPALKAAVRDRVPELRNEPDERVEEYIRRERIYLTPDEMVPLMRDFSERYGGLDHAVVYVRAQPATGAKIGKRISRLMRNDRIPVQYAGETFAPQTHRVEPVNVAGAEASARIRYLEHTLAETDSALTQTKERLTSAAGAVTALEEALSTYTDNPNGAVAQQQRIAKLRTELEVERGDYARESRNAEQRHRRDLEKAVGLANGRAEEERKALETRIAAAETAQRTAEKQAGNWQDALGMVMHYFEPSNSTTLDRLESDAAERFGLQSPMYQGLQLVIAGIRGHLQSVYTSLEEITHLQRATKDKLGEKKKEIERLTKTTAAEQAEIATFVHKVVGYLVNKAEVGAVRDDATLYRTARRDGFADALDAVASFLNAYHDRITAAQESEAARHAAEGKYEGLEARARGEKDVVERESEEARSRAKELGDRLQEYATVYSAVIGALNSVARYLTSPPEEGATVDFHSDILRERATVIEGTDTNLYNLLTAMADVMEGVGGIEGKEEKMRTYEAKEGVYRSIMNCFESGKTPQDIAIALNTVAARAVEAGHLEEGAFIYQITTVVQPINPWIPLEVAGIHIKRGMYDAAIAACDKAEAIARANITDVSAQRGVLSWTNFWRGKSYEGRGDFLPAQEAYAQALTLDSKNQAANEALARITEKR